MFSYRSMYVLAGLLLASTATAGDAPFSKPFDISTPQSFHAQAATVQAGMQPEGIYASLSTQDRARVEHLIADMDALFQRRAGVQAMSGAERVDLFNAQESANQILTRGRTGNIRCAWARQTGTHISHTVCWSTRP